MIQRKSLKYNQIQLLEDMKALRGVGVEVTFSLLAKAKGLTKHRVSMVMYDAECVGLVACTSKAWRKNCALYTFELTDAGLAVINAYHRSVWVNSDSLEESLEAHADYLLSSAGEVLLDEKVSLSLPIA